MARKGRATGDWYSARLLYEFVHDPPDVKPKPLFEESLVVFKAVDGSVLKTLLELARGKEHNYQAAAGNHVYYTFRELLEVQEISGDKIEQGTEVFFRFWDNPGPRAFKVMRDTHREPWWLDENRQ
jgi:Domain of unknown function (DUF4288)